MKDIIKLSKLEFGKLFKTKTAKLGIILSFFIMITLTISEYNDIKRVREYEKINESSEEWDWRGREEFMLSQKDSMLNDPYYDEMEKHK